MSCLVTGTTKLNETLPLHQSGVILPDRLARMAYLLDFSKLHKLHLADTSLLYHLTFSQYFNEIICFKVFRRTTHSIRCDSTQHAQLSAVTALSMLGVAELRAPNQTEPKVI